MKDDLFAITPSLSLVVPVFNEEGAVERLHQRLSAVLATLPELAEILFVNDGSRDRSGELLAALHEQDQRVGVITLSRNFGKEAAMAAGLEASRGECVIVLDADLQHPPELIPQMLQAWQAGADVVNMRRRSRDDEHWAKRRAARAFYRVLNGLSDVPIPADVGDFRLYSRRAVDALCRLQERARFTKGLAAWIGFRQVTLDYDVAARCAGATKWRARQLWHFAVEGITAFSVAPLRMASHAGLLCAVVALALAGWFAVKSMMFGDPVPGFPTLVVLMLLLGGLQLLAIGVLGEYLGRLAVEAKQRPMYVTQDFLHPLAMPASQRADGQALHKTNSLRGRRLPMNQGAR